MRSPTLLLCFVALIVLSTDYGYTPVRHGIDRISAYDTHPPSLRQHHTPNTPIQRRSTTARWSAKPPIEAISSWVESSFSRAQCWTWRNCR
ncbi:MAG: hypothetical protein AB3X41_02565 [Leptothrix ochracea]|uniref:hypothetical protein n=1 Tax=Leptothrix ochracea TaxID=735331 RepID=UPI0034E27724